MSNHLFRVCIVFSLSFLLCSHVSTAQTKHPATAQQLIQIMSRPITLSAKDEDASKVLAKMFEQAGANYALNVSYSKRVSVSFNKVPFTNALTTTLKSIGYWYTISNGVFAVEPILSPYDGPRSGLPSIPPGSPRKVQLNFASASSVANQLRTLPGFRPEDGITITASRIDNTILVITQSEQQYAEIREWLRMLDLQPRVIDIRSDITVKAPGKPARTYSATARTANDVRFAFDSTFPYGINKLSAVARINGDNSVTLSVTWNVTTGKKNTRFTGHSTIAEYQTRMISKCSVPIGQGRSAELQLYLTPVLRHTERDSYYIPDTEAIVIRPFVNKSGIGGSELASAATDAFTNELSGTRRYDVIKKKTKGTLNLGWA